MKINRAVIRIAALFMCAAMSGNTGFSQPGVINPATGIPTPAPIRAGATKAVSTPGQIDPGTGIGITPKPPGERTPNDATDGWFQTGNRVNQLIFNGRYEEALQALLAYHEEFKTSGSLATLLPTWIELGRRYPKAKTELLKIRDHDVREFSEGRGYHDLFQELFTINNQLHDEDSTYDVYNELRDKDPTLAQQCFPLVEGLLVARGEYQWCYDHMGKPEDTFDGIHEMLNRLRDTQKRVAASEQRSQQMMAQARHQRGLADLDSPPTMDHTASRKRMADDMFVGQSCQLIEILVATGHKAEAKKIAAEALKVVDDDRLKTSLEDAAERIKKKPPVATRVKI